MTIRARERERRAQILSLWQQRASGKRTEEDVVVFYREMERSFPHLLSRQDGDPYQSLMRESQRLHRRCWRSPMNKKGPTKRCFFVRPNSFGCSNARSLTPKPEGRNRRRFAYRPRRRRRSGNLRHQEKSAKRRHRNGQKTAVFQHSKPIAKRFQPKTLAAPDHRRSRVFIA